MEHFDKGLFRSEAIQSYITGKKKTSDPEINLPRKIILFWAFILVCFSCALLLFSFPIPITARVFIDEDNWNNFKTNISYKDEHLIVSVPNQYLRYIHKKLNISFEELGPEIECEVIAVETSDDRLTILESINVKKIADRSANNSLLKLLCSQSSLYETTHNEQIPERENSKLVYLKLGNTQVFSFIPIKLS